MREADELKRYAIIDEITSVALLLEEAQRRIGQLVATLNILRELEREGGENGTDEQGRVAETT